MEPFAVPGDIEAVWRPLSATEAVVAEGLIDQASVALRLRVPGIDALIAGNELLTAAAKAAVVNAVKRVLQNPDLDKQWSETTGPFTEFHTVSDSISSGALYFTAADLFGLVPSESGIPGTARVRSGYPRPARTVTAWSRP